MVTIAITCLLLAVRFVTKDGVAAYMQSSTFPTYGDGKGFQSPGFMSHSQPSMNKMSRTEVSCDPSNPNYDLCQLLTELASYEKNVAGNIKQHDRYLETAKVLGRCGMPIKSGQEARKILGIRYEISNIIDEFLETGVLEKMSTNPNYDLCELLIELSKNEIKNSGNVHKCNAYRKAAKALANHSTRIQSGIEARKLQGIGESISRQIDEFIETEKLRKLPSNPNYDLCEYLIELGDYERKVSGNINSYNAYRKGARALATIGKRITSGTEARKLDGIGEVLSRKIDEFIETEKLRKLPSNPNYDLCEYFSGLAENELKSFGNIHKYNAYRKASRTLATFGKQIKSGEEAQKIDGIGEGIASLINKFLESEKLKQPLINPNHDISEFLFKLADRERSVSGNITIFNTYMKAAKSIANYNIPIKSGEDARKLEGIDDNISNQIDKFLNSEKLRKRSLNPNYDICEFLSELADFEKNVARNINKYDLYHYAIDVLTRCGIHIKSGAEARKTLGISYQIANVIDEFLEVGVMEKLSPNPNYDLCELLIELGHNEIKSSGNVFNYNAYRKAVSIVAQYHTRLLSGMETKNLKGVNENVLEKIEEFVETEKLRRLPSNPNHDLCEYFYELGDYERKVSGDNQKYISYRKTARVLATHGTQIKSGEEAQKLEGINENVSKLIDDYLGNKRLKTQPLNPNHDLCTFLSELSDHERRVSGNLPMYKSYQTAVLALSSLKTQIKSIEEARQLKGIDEIILEKINVFLTQKFTNTEHVTFSVTTNTLNTQYDVKKDRAAIMKELTAVNGIGLSKAKKLYKQGITSIDLLIKNINTSSLNQHQKFGVKYYYEFLKRVPRVDVYELEKFIKITFNDFDPDFNVSICGTYRLGEEYIGDIVILVTHSKITSKTPINENNKLEIFVDILNKKNLISESISMKNNKFMGVCKINNISRRIDIYFSPHDQYYCSQLYLTGNRAFFKRMKEQAKANHFQLTEISLSPEYAEGMLGEPLEITSEEEIFEYLKTPYKKPEERNA